MGHEEEQGSAKHLRFEPGRQEIRKRSSLGETRRVESLHLGET